MLLFWLKSCDGLIFSPLIHWLLNTHAPFSISLIPFIHDMWLIGVFKWTTHLLRVCLTCDTTSSNISTSWKHGEKSSSLWGPPGHRWFNSFSAVAQQPRAIQRAESLAELKTCQEDQTGGKPRPLPLQLGGKSLLIIRGRGLLGHLHSHGLAVGAWLRGIWKRAHLISTMIWALICVTGSDMHSRKMTEPTCQTRLEGVHVTLEMQRYTEYRSQGALLTCPRGASAEM